jgi:hypothetical protein
VRIADVPERYRGTFTVSFAHPLLVRCAIDYRPLTGGEPAFRHEFVLTPDGILATLRSADAKKFGVTWPLLADDGALLRTRLADRIATTAYAENTDQQCFLALDAGSAVEGDEDPVQSTYGWLRPVRATAVGGVNHTFVYPRNAEDPPADKVEERFRLTKDGYESDVGSVTRMLYVGRTSAGGEGERIDIDHDGRPDATFSAPCRFVLQLRAGRIFAVEADRKTSVLIGGKQTPLDVHVPVEIGG